MAACLAGDGRRAAAGRGELSVPPCRAALPAAALPQVRALSAAHRGPGSGLERGAGDRSVSRPADEPGVPAGPAAGLRHRRREHGPDTGVAARQGARVSRPGVPPAPGGRRHGQGAHPQPRARAGSCRRLDAGRADHGLGRDLRAGLAAADDAAPGRSGSRLGERLHQGGQPARQLHDQVHRLRVHHRAGRGPPQPERPGCGCLPGGRGAAALAREHRGDRRPHRHRDTGRGHRDDLPYPADRSAGGIRAARGRLGRGAAHDYRSVEAAAPLGPGEHPGHPAVQLALVPATLAAGTPAPAGERQLRAVLVLAAAPAGLS